MIATKKKLTQVVIKHDGNQAAAAKEVGMTRQAVQKRIKKNPDIRSAIEKERAKAIKLSGLSRVEVYKVARAGMKAKRLVGEDMVEYTDYKERRESAKLCAQLLGDLATLPPPVDNAQQIFHIYFPPKLQIEKPKPAQKAPIDVS